jgi:adenosylmethionine-8-amino-7-oxononanoate aminotransferase
MALYSDAEQLIVDEARGCWLRDVRGREYLDGVSSLWVNVHGHGHEAIVSRLRAQLDRLDHSTLLGPSSVPAIELAERLLRIVPRGLSRVFYSDSGSTAVEAALKIAWQFHAQHREPSMRERTHIVALKNAYHGDTLGSVSVGGMDLFHATYRPLLFPVLRSPAPDPYHDPARPSAEAHEAACLLALRSLLDRHAGQVAAVIVEPLVLGAAGMLTHSRGWLSAVATLVRKAGALLIVDEVATGFGRTGTMFACEQAGIEPDLLCAAKGISGGVLPLAATFATERVFDGFLGAHTEYRTFFHGHSYTGNPLACAAGLGSLDAFEADRTLERLPGKIARLADGLRGLVDHPHVGDVRRIGVMTGIELVRDRDTREPFDPALRMGHRTIVAARDRGVLLRPLGDVVVLMPPLSISDDEIDFLLHVVTDAIAEATG